MAWTFSKRCKQTLKDGKIKVSIPIPVRVRILSLLENFSPVYWEKDNDEYESLYQTSILQQLPEKIRSEIGLKDLLSYPENGDTAVPSDIKSFILRGNYPPHLFDVIELFYSSLKDDANTHFQRVFNQIIEESNLCWRMLDGKILPIDSSYIEEEITRRAYSLLHEVKFHGVLQEFEKARTDFTNENYEGAIQNANCAVESTIKGILNIQRAKPGELFTKLIDEGLVPEYYSGFLKVFKDNILRSVAIIRNEELGVGHGRGVNPKETPKSLAELAINLTGVLIKYLITRHLETLGEKSDTVQENDEDVPF